MQDCYSCDDLEAKSSEIHRLHQVCRVKDSVMKSLIEAGQTALTTLETLGYVGGDIHDDLASAIDEGKETLG